MSGLEFNKIAASVLVAGLVAMVVGTMTDALYQPQEKLDKRGFQVEVTEDSASGGAPTEEEVKIGQLMSSADAAKGKDYSSKCAVCHNFEEGKGMKIGPDLWEVIGRPKAKVEGFTYSSAMLAKGGDWSYEDLYHFLKSPRKFIPGTKMSFAGFGKKEDVANVIAYLRSLSANPKPLPPVEEQ
jgi:cytochrome c